MAIRPLVILPDALLRKPSEPIGEITPAIRALAQDMLDTMYDAPGIGLAAVQIGEMVRLVTIDISKKSEDDEETPKAPMVFVNPEIVWASDELNVHEEGCLSIPDYYEEVERPARVRVRYRDLDGAAQEIEADGILATCLQHEIDHLEGVLFIDHLSRLKRERVTKRFAKQARRESAA
ncbi:peptide deformylase [Bosea sp. TWI1241]|jgi:peptide deformylase|uniref:peptide deformylase n=1 Tax=Bosea sp. TWI1241 TaxID=3148904 RepID=UPI00320AFE7F